MVLELLNSVVPIPSLSIFPAIFGILVRAQVGSFTVLTLKQHIKSKHNCHGGTVDSYISFQHSRKSFPEASSRLPSHHTSLAQLPMNTHRSVPKPATGNRNSGATLSQTDLRVRLSESDWGGGGCTEQAGKGTLLGYCQKGGGVCSEHTQIKPMCPNSF